MYFSIEDDDLLKTIWDKISANMLNNLIVSLSKIKKFWKPK